MSAKNSSPTETTNPVDVSSLVHGELNDWTLVVTDGTIHERCRFAEAEAQILALKGEAPVNKLEDLKVKLFKLLDRRHTSTLQIIVFLVDIFTSARQQFVLFDVTCQIVEFFFDVIIWIPKFISGTSHKTPNRLATEHNSNKLRLKDATETSNLLEHDRNPATNQSALDLDEANKTSTRLRAERDQFRAERDQLKEARKEKIISLYYLKPVWCKVSLVY